MQKIRVIVLEDSRVLRKRLSTMIKGQPDLKLVASVGDSDALASKAFEAKPQLLLLDLGARNHSTVSRVLNIVREVRKELPSTKVVAIGLLPTQDDIFEFVEAGISGFVPKDATVQKFLKTIRAVSRGTCVLPSTLAASLFTSISAHAVSMEHADHVIDDAIRITERERQVIALIAGGLTNKEIGARLNVSTYTVKSHVHSILGKLTMSSRHDIARYGKQAEHVAVAHTAISLMDE